MRYEWILAYRALPPQEFRREQLLSLIDNVGQLHAANPQHTYHVWVIEQGNDRPFNRGWLLNAGFLEAVREASDAVFVHCNADYALPVGPMPPPMQAMPDGVHDVHGVEYALGGLCFFSADAYWRCNGFPVNLWGWGGEDIAIAKRLQIAGVPVVRYENLYNKWATESRDHVRDQSANIDNIAIGLNVSADTLGDNGITTTRYRITGSRDVGCVSWRTIDGEEVPC